MKLKRFLAVLLVLVLVLAGCSGLSEAIDDPDIRAQTEALLTAFVENDFDACRALVAQNVTDEQLREVLGPIHGVLADLGDYELTAEYRNRTVKDGTDVTTIRYLLSGGNGKYYLSVGKTAGVAGLSGFQLSEAAADTQPTAPAGAIHRVVTAIGYLTMIFILWMAVDCVRRKVKNKWLWLLAILLGTVLFQLTMNEGGFSWRFNVGLQLGLTNLATFIGGGFRLNVYAPIAAMVYFIKRKELTILPAPEVEADVQREEEAEKEA